MKFRIFIFFVCVSCFNIVSSYHKYQEFGHEYQQHSDGPIHRNYVSNSPMYPAYSQSVNHALPSHVSPHTSHPQPRYIPYHQRKTFVEDPIVYENNAKSPAQSQVKLSNVEYKPLEYIPQPHQELPRPYPVDKTFELHVPPAEHVYRQDYTQHVAKPWVSQNTYQRTVHQEPYHQPPVHQKPYHQRIVYSEPQPSVYQHPPPLQHAQPQHPLLPEHTQPVESVRLPHQQSYYKSQLLNEVPVAHTQAQAYATSETNVADILASKPEVKDDSESALFEHYQLNDLSNSHHVKSSEVKLEENDNDIERTTEKPHNNNHNNRQFPKQLLDNVVNENKKLRVPQKNNHIVNPQTVPKVTKHETIPLQNDDNETLYHPRFAYLNHKENPTEVKTFPIEIKPVYPRHYRNPIVKHHPNAKHSDNILVNEKQKPAVPLTPLGNTDGSYLIELQHSNISESSTLIDKDVTLNDYNLPAHEQRNKKQSEPQPHVDKIHPENDYIPTIKYSEIPSHSKLTDQIIIDNPVDISVDTSSEGNNKPKDSFDDVNPTLFYSDTKAPLIAPNSNDKPDKELYSELRTQPEVAKPITETNNRNVVTNTTVATKNDMDKIVISEIDVTKLNKIDYKQKTINENVFDNGGKLKAEFESRSTIPEDIAKQSSIEGSLLNADSPTDEGMSTEDENLQNNDCTSGEIDPNNNADDEEADDSKININTVLLSSIDLWEKLLAKQPNLEFQAFNVVTLSPIVEKTSRLFAFPNHTTVEESVETVWEHKGDELPLEIRLTTIIKNPPQKPDAVKSDKTETDQTKYDLAFW